MKKFIVLGLLICFSTVLVSAQSADAVSRLIEADKATVGQTGYFLSVYLELVPETASEADAVNALIGAGICKEGVTADTELTFASIAGMCMRTWKVSGGVMYTLTKSDHYAFREMQAQGLVAASADPMESVSGFNAMLMINDCLTKYDTED